MAASTLPNEAITPKSLYTITGAAAAVWLFGAVLYTVLGQRVDEVIYRSIAFGLSVIIAIGMLIEKKTYNLKYWLLIIPNSALIFVNASGFNAVNTGSFDAPGVASKKINSATSTSIPSGEIGSVQKASFLPFLKDIAWWPDALLKEKVEALEEINDSLKTENKILLQKSEGTNSMDPLKAADSKNRIATLEAQIEALQLENTTLKTGNTNNSDLTSKIEKLNATINSLRKQLDDKDAQLQQARNALTAASTKLNDCLKRGGSNDALNDRINSLNAQLDQNKKNLSACENKLRNAENTIQSLNNQLKNCNTKPGDPDGSPVVLDLQAELRKCKSLLANSGNNTNLQGQVTDLQTKLNSCQGQIEKYNSALSNYKSNLGQCNSQLRAVRDSLTSCQKSRISKTTNKIGGK